jgi:hypothetical protein
MFVCFFQIEIEALLSLNPDLIPKGHTNQNVIPPKVTRVSKASCIGWIVLCCWWLQVSVLVTWHITSSECTCHLAHHFKWVYLSPGTTLQVSVLVTWHITSSECTCHLAHHFKRVYLSPGTSLHLLTNSGTVVPPYLLFQLSAVHRDPKKYGTLNNKRFISFKTRANENGP